MASRQQLLEIVRRECALKLEWTGPDCVTEKYMALLRPAMRARGHRALDAVKVSWCAGFVWWCCRETGLELPPAPPGHHATFALVNAWRDWARQLGIFTPLSFADQGAVPEVDSSHSQGTAGEPIAIEPGDILTMRLASEDNEFDHIGFCLQPPAEGRVATGEGNRKNRAALGTRPLNVLDGLIRLDELEAVLRS